MEIFAQSKEALHVTLLGSGWNSSAGGLSTFNREFAIQLSQLPHVRVSLLVPEGACTDEDKREAQTFGISILDARKQLGFSEPLDWLGFPPQEHRTDVVVGHGVKLGRQVKVIKRSPQFQSCKWVHMVHTAPEDLGKYKDYDNPTSRGEQKHWDEVDLCKDADLVVPVGPKLKQAYSSSLQGCKKDEVIFEIVPGLFNREFGALEQKATVESDDFIVLLCGRGDDEDFELKGYDIAAKAFADQCLKGKRYHLLFVGAPDGKQDEVRRRFLDFGITDEQLKVRKFVQSRAGMRDLFCEVDLVIMPSKSEGFGLVALEALSAGLPILVGSNSGFARALEKVDFGDTCIIHSNEPAKWAKEIEGVRAKHKKRLSEMTSIRESYKEMFCWKEQCENLVEKLRKMVHENRPTWKPELTDAAATIESKNFEKDPLQRSLPQVTETIFAVVIAFLLYQIWSHPGDSNHDDRLILPAELLETVSYVPLGQNKTLPCDAFREALIFEGGQLRVVHWFRWIPLRRGLCVCVPGSNCSCESGKKCTRACLQVDSQASFLLVASMHEDGHVHMKEHWWKPFSISRDDGGLYIDKVHPGLTQKYMCVVQIRSKIEPFTSIVTLRLAGENGLPEEPWRTLFYVPLGQSKTLPCAAFSEALKCEGGQFRAVYWFMWRRAPHGVCVCAPGNDCSCESGKKCTTACVDVDLETDFLLLASMDEDGRQTVDRWKPFSISILNGGLFIPKVNPALAQKFMCVVKVRSTIEPLTSTVSLRLEEEKDLPTEPLKTFVHVRQGQKVTVSCPSFDKALKLGRFSFLQWYGLESFQTQWTFLARMNEDGSRSVDGDWYKGFNITRDGGLYIHESKPFQQFRCTVELRSGRNPLTNYVTLKLEKPEQSEAGTTSGSKNLGKVETTDPLLGFLIGNFVMAFLWYQARSHL
ncbi:uncharacterized protein [Montipora foliosa]|uniref:uncharacterized protein isoform X1 n=1 Tax=Montipora foliosa TaxID=591990 RepID=UPI0035F215F8